MAKLIIIVVTDICTISVVWIAIFIDFVVIDIVTFSVVGMKVVIVI